MGNDRRASAGTRNLARLGRGLGHWARAEHLRGVACAQRQGVAPVAGQLALAALHQVAPRPDAYCRRGRRIVAGDGRPASTGEDWTGSVMDQLQRLLESSASEGRNRRLRSVGVGSSNSTGGHIESTMPIAARFSWRDRPVDWERSWRSMVPEIADRVLETMTEWLDEPLDVGRWTECPRLGCGR